MRAELRSGAIVELPKGYQCETHDQPHWLHWDALERARAKAILDRFTGDTIDQQTAWAICAIEINRLQYLRREMELCGIARLIPGEGE